MNDFGSTATGALGGASTGAALGSVFPGIGTAVGAGVGALAGGLGSSGLSFGGASGAGGSGSNPNTAQVYLPANQASADAQFWTSLNQMANAANAGNLPGQFAAGPAQTAATNIFDNPFANQAISGAYNAAPLGTAVGQGQIAGGQALQGYGTAGLPAGMQALSTAFDPQQSLYNQQFGQNLNQANAVNSMSGVAGTPYGAGITNQSNQNFNNQWLNQLLGREQVGAQTYGAIGQGAGNALTAGGNLGTQGYSNIATSAGLPYAASTGQNQQALSALANYLSVANNQFAIPQQLVGDVNQYMGLGQSASQLSGQLGQQGVNQLYQGMGGIGSLLGLVNGGGGLGTIGSLGSGAGYGGGIGNFLTAANAGILGVTPDAAYQAAL